MTPAVSVVIVNLNRRDLVERCLQSLFRQTFTNYEVIVVDNGSSDDSVAYLSRLEEPRLKIVTLPENRGFAGGCNAGIAVAEGSFVATLNNDAEPDERWLEQLLHAADSKPHVGMVASKILFHGDRSRIDKVGHLMFPDGLNHGRGSGEKDLGQYEESQEVLFPDGAAALYRREMLEQVGAFDETFFAYGDDADLGLRGRVAGWNCIYSPTAVVYHIHSATAGKFSPLKAFLIERNRIFVLIKVFPAVLIVVSPLFTVVRLVFHAYGALFNVGSSGQYATGGSRFGLMTAILKAYWSALKHTPTMWRSRRKIRRFTRLSTGEFIGLLWKHRISLRALTLGS